MTEISVSGSEEGFNHRVSLSEDNGGLGGGAAFILRGRDVINPANHTILTDIQGVAKLYTEGSLASFNAPLNSRRLVNADVVHSIKFSVFLVCNQ